MSVENAKIDHKIIAKIIEPGSKVLDLGCGDGDLLKYLVDEKNAKVQGVEISENAIYKCVEKGLNVFHSDIDSGLKDYPDKTFDYVILNQSLQEVKNIDYVLDEAFRAGKKVIVGFPNFAHFKARFMLFFSGKSPVTVSLPNKWNDTPNIRFLSINDFKDFCKEKGYNVLASYFFSKDNEINILPNLFATSAVFLLERSR